jgi:hypothetical protein
LYGKADHATIHVSLKSARTRTPWSPDRLTQPLHSGPLAQPHESYTRVWAAPNGFINFTVPPPPEPAAPMEAAPAAREGVSGDGGMMMTPVARDLR